MGSQKSARDLATKQQISSLEKCLFTFLALLGARLFVLLLLNCNLIYFYDFIYIFTLKILKMYVLSLGFLYELHSAVEPP